MSTSSLVPDAKPSLKEFLSDAPATVKPYIKRGFAVLGGLGSKQVSELAEVLKNSVDRAGELDIAFLSDRLGIDSDSAGVLASATSLLIALILTREEGADEIMHQLIDSGLASRESDDTILSLLESLQSDKSAIRHQSEINELATETLPAFKSLDLSIDLRLRFKGASIDLTVPVVIASLQTDVSRSNTFFQLKKADVLRLAEQFAKVKEQIEAAEKWIPKSN